jgi:SAM-dependent methyltransferase
MVRLELGAGARAREGFVAVDLNPRYADVVADARSLPWEDGEVEAIRAVDVLEHISYRDTDAALAEWARVLEPGGKLYVQVPDVDAAIRLYLTWPDDCTRRMPTAKGALGWLEWVLLGGHADGRFAEPGDDFRLNAHYSLWSHRTLEGALARAGFTDTEITTNDHPNLMCNTVRA